MISTTSVINRLFGYARISTDDQNLSLQIDALIRFGVSRTIFTPTRYRE